MTKAQQHGAALEMGCAHLRAIKSGQEEELLEIN
jgi:hypothetical protein